jgi:hypothetical protein
MGVRKLLAWQWSDYPDYHRSRTNLAIHIVAVPLFLFGNVWFLVALVSRTPMPMVLALLLTVGSLVAQGKGHDLEEKPPVPFTGPGNAIARLMLEQWVTFPRFVATGGWARARRGVAA